MRVTICNYAALPAWVDKNDLSNNGDRAEYATYLLIEDGNYRRCYSDAMEPEDATFSRDLNWIKAELERGR